MGLDTIHVCADCLSRLDEGAERCPRCGRDVRIVYHVSEEAAPDEQRRLHRRLPPRVGSIVIVGALALALALGLGVLVAPRTEPSKNAAGPSVPPVGLPSVPPVGGRSEANAAGFLPVPTGTNLLVFLAGSPITGNPLFAEGHGAMLVDLDRGTSRRVDISVLQRPLPQSIPIVVGDMVVFVSGSDALAVTRELDGTVMGLRQADFVLPEPGIHPRVLLLSRNGQGTFDGREVDLAQTGTIVETKPNLLAANGFPVAIVSTGIVMVNEDPLARARAAQEFSTYRAPRRLRVEVWTGRGDLRLRLHRPRTFIDAWGDHIAWLGPPCTAKGRCSLRLTNFRTGEELTLEATSFTGGGFSPDGRWLAVVADAVGPGSLVTIVDVRSGRVASVIRTEAEMLLDCFSCLSWSPSGDWLFFVAYGGGQLQIHALRPGDESTVVVPLDFPLTGIVSVLAI